MKYTLSAIALVVFSVSSLPAFTPVVGIVDESAASEPFVPKDNGGPDTQPPHGTGTRFTYSDECNRRRGRRECLPLTLSGIYATDDNGCNRRRGRRECLPLV